MLYHNMLQRITFEKPHPSRKNSQTKFFQLGKEIILDQDYVLSDEIFATDFDWDFSNYTSDQIC